MGVFLLNPIQVALEVLCGLAFWRSKKEDTEVNRHGYFSMYTVYTALLGLLRIISVIWDPSEKAIIRDFCGDLYLSAAENNKGWEATNFESMTNCKDVVSYDMMTDQLTILGCILVTQVYFIIVLYSHFKNGSLEVAKGGC